ncbi:MAG: hypothetical protein ACI3Y8_05200 [Candidatus Cryptobacteroides sp.]
MFSFSICFKCPGQSLGLRSISAAEKPDEPVKKSALFAGRPGSVGILQLGRFLAKNHLKPFVYNALNLLARENWVG